MSIKLGILGIWWTMRSRALTLRHGGSRGAAFLLAWLVLLAVALPVGAQQDTDARDDATRRLEERKRELDAARSREQTLSQDIDALSRERAQLNEQLIETARRVQAAESQMSEIEARLAELAGSEGRIRSSIVQRHDTIAKLLGAMQRIGGSPPPSIITRRDDVLKMVRSAMMMASLYPELKSQADNLSRDLDQLLHLQKDMTAAGERLEQEGRRLAAERVRVSALLAEKKKIMSERQEELAGIRKAAEQHSRSVEQLSELLQRMDAEMSARMASYEAELAARKVEAETTARGGAVVEVAPKPTQVAFVSPGRIKPAIPFGDAKGTLRLPAQGRTVRAFGAPDGFGGTLKGASLQTRDEAQVTSPTDGWVAYAGEFRGYGQLLIINAGGGYHVLLAGMRQIDVTLGQFVLAGEPVAVMGSSPPRERQGSEQSRPVLYIEFRKDGQPVDPGPWWAGSPEKVQG